MTDLGPPPERPSKEFLNYEPERREEQPSKEFLNYEPEIRPAEPETIMGPEMTMTEPLQPEADDPGPAGQFYQGGDQGPTGDFYPEINALVTPGDRSAMQRSKSLFDEYAKALADGDIGLANGIRQQQMVESAISQARVDALGLPPETRAPNNAWPNTAIEMQRLMDIDRMKREQANMILRKHLWTENYNDWFNTEVAAPYAERNKSQLMVSTAGMDPQQKLIAQQQLQPIVKDPMLVADKRQGLAKIDADLKAIDPTWSVFTYGPTRKVAGWINREYSVSGGYLQSGKIEGEGFLGKVGGEVAATALHGIEEGLISPLLGAFYGAMKVVGMTPPTNYIEGPDGQILTNEGKIPNLTEIWIATSARLSGDDVVRRLAEHGRLEQAEESELYGDKSILGMVRQASRGIASFAAMGYGVGLPLAKTMGWGQKTALGMMQHGLTRMAVSGSPKAAKAFTIATSTTGAAVGAGIGEMAMYGDREGYLKAFQGGLMIGPVLTAFGAAGRQMGARADKAWERLTKRERMPARMREAVEGLVEGGAFGAMADIHAYQAFEGSLWEYLKNPSQERWMHYATAVIGLGSFKFLKKPPQEPVHDPQATAMARTEFRRGFAKKVSDLEARVSRETEPSDDLIRRAQQLSEDVAAGQRLTAEEERFLMSQTEHVSGKEPGREDFREAREQIKGKLPGPEEQMRQAQRGELDEGQRVQTADVLKARGEAGGVDPLDQPKFRESYSPEALARMEGRRAEVGRTEGRQGFDPLEDPRFMERSPEERRAILERRDAGERRRVAEEDFGGEERREGERRDLVKRREDLERRQGKAGTAEAPTGPPDRAEIAAARQGDWRSHEARQRVTDLLRRARGAFLERAAAAMQKGAAQVKQYRETGPPKAPVTHKRRYKDLFPGFKRRHKTLEQISEDLLADELAWRERQDKAGVPPELTEKQKELREAARDAGVDFDLVKRLGDELRIVEDMQIPRERREEAFERVQRLEEDLDTQEAMSDPALNPKLLDELRERGLEAVEAGDLEMPSATKGAVDPVSVDPVFGERYGPDSMRAGANPYRQQQELARDETLDRMISEIFQIMEGKQDRPGFRIPLTGKRIWGRKGSPVQIAIREGKVGASSLGVFKVYENLARTKEGLDLIVGLHEWAHGMHRQVFAGRGGDEFWEATKKQYRDLPPEAKQEIQGILQRYPGWEKLTRHQLMAEAWAEWHARNLLGDPNLREAFPVITREIDAWMNAPAQRAFRDGQYRDLMMAVRNWKDMGSRRRVSMTIRREGRTPKPYDKPSFISEATDAAVKAFFDDKILLKRSQERWISRSDLNAEELSILLDPSRMIDTVSLTATKEAESFMLRGPHDIAFKRIRGVQSFKSIMDDVAGTGTKTEKNARIIDFVDLVYATRAMEMLRKGKIMNAPLSDYVQAAKEILELNPHFKGKMEALKQWTDSLLDLIVEAAQLSPADAKRLKGDGDGVVYIPFHRIIRNSVSRFGGGRGVAEAGTGLKAFKGGSREELVDPVKAMEDVTVSMIVKARKAMVMRSLYKLMLHTDVGGLVSQVPKGIVAKRYRLDQVMQQMKKEVDKELYERGNEKTAEEWEEAFGVLAELLKGNDLSEALVTLFAQKDLPFGEKEPILAMVPRLTEAEIAAIPSRAGRRQAKQNQGKMIWLQLDPAAFEGLMGIGTPLSQFSMGEGLVKQAVELPKSTLRFFATDANPAFVLRNMMRDAVLASVFDRHGKLVPFKGFAMLAQGGYMQMRYGSQMTPFLDRMLGEGNAATREKWEMFEASGASTSSYFNEGLRRGLRGQVQSVTSQTKAALDWWKRTMAAPESWIRVAEFGRVLDKARTAGKSELEASYEALEAAREVTVNFARAGDIARSYSQMTPYFSATMAGQRKMFRALLGQEGRSDAERAAYQRRVWAQALANITLPVVAAWMTVKDEEWYQDLPEWRKKNFMNFKLPGTDEIMSLPLPFEAGTLFGSIPVAWLEQQTGGNPIDISDAFIESLWPYFEHQSALIPAFIRPIAETATGRDFFRGQELTPFWIEKTKTPEKQVRQSTTKTAQWMYQIFGKNIPTVDNPIELEQLMGGYTAGFTTSIMKMIDDISGLKDHPGFLPTPIGAFTRQTPHGASRAVNDLYDEGKRIEQIESSERTPGERSKITRINRAKQEFSRIRKDLELGRIEKTEADRRMFQIAHRIIGRSQ